MQNTKASDWKVALTVVPAAVEQSSFSPGKQLDPATCVYHSADCFLYTARFGSNIWLVSLTSRKLILVYHRSTVVYHG